MFCTLNVHQPLVPTVNDELNYNQQNCVFLLIQDLEIEQLSKDLDALKKENFNLKKKLDKQQTHIDMKKSRRGTVST